MRRTFAHALTLVILLGAACRQSTSSTVGPAGGAVEFQGGVLTVPAGALSTSEVIGVAQSGSPPATYLANSPLYDFSPSGLQFSAPVQVSIEFQSGTGEQLSIYWSSETGSGYDQLPSTVSGTTLTAEVTHFSSGFVGHAQTGDGGGCPGAQVMCPSGCADRMTSPSNCGSCGYACPIGQACSGGTCYNPQFCKTSGMNCTYGNECCTGVCSVGMCVTLP